MKYQYRRPKLYRKKRKFSSRRVLAPGRVRDVYPSSFYTALPNQMCLRLRSEEDVLLTIGAQGYGAWAKYLMNPRGANIGMDDPVGTAWTYPGGMRALHSLYQRSVVEKVTLTYEITSTTSNACQLTTGVLTHQDYNYVNPPDAVGFHAARSRADWKSYTIQADHGNSHVRCTQTVDLKKLYLSLLTQDQFSTFSDRTGQMNFPAVSAESPMITMLFSGCENDQAILALKMTVDYHMRFFDLHILQARNNIA